MNNSKEILTVDKNNYIRQQAKSFAKKFVEDNKEDIKKSLKYGSVPIIYKLPRDFNRQKQKDGILSLMRKSKSEKEIKNLITKGKTEFKKVSDGTLKKWEKELIQKTSR